MIYKDQEDTDEKIETSDAQLEIEQDESGVVRKVMKSVREAIEATKSWNKVAREDQRFSAGDQWTNEEREALEEQGRPCLTFNKIEPLLALVAGWERENSFRIRVFPEGGEDRIFSEIGDRILKAVDKWSKLNYKLDYVFDDGINCGKGWLEMAITYDYDIIHGDLIFRNRTPFQILVDPDSVEYDHEDAEHMIKMVKVTKSKLKTMYPKKVAIIDDIREDINFIGETFEEGDKDNYHLGKSDIDENIPGDISDDKGDAKLWLFEKWYKIYKDRYFVYDVNSARLLKFDDEAEATAKRDEIIAQAQDKQQKALAGFQLAQVTTQMSMAQEPQIDPATGMPQPPPQAPTPPSVEIPDIRVITRKVPQMWYCAVVSGKLLQEEIISPFEPYYSGFPFFNYYANWNPSIDDDELRIKGVTRSIKDANREINKSRSQFLHILNTSANSGWVGDEDALTPEGWKDLERLGSMAGITIKKKPGKELSRIESSAPNMANIMRGDKAEQDIKEISGINPDAMAIQDKTTSGKAISLRIKQALTILSKYFRNFRYTKEMIGGAIFSMIPEIFDVPTIRKVIGEDFMAANQIDDGTLTAFLAQISDGKYDINITEADNSATIRQETFEQLMEMAQSGMPIPPEVMLEFASIPNAKEIGEKIMAYQQQQMAMAQAKAAPQGGK
jgi:hypothetical protein